MQNNIYLKKGDKQMEKTLFELKTSKIRVQAKTIQEGLKMLLDKRVRKNVIVTITEYIDNGEYLQFIPFSNLYIRKATLTYMLQEYNF